MRALVYHGPGNKVWEEVPDPTIAEDTDAIVRVDAVTICGTPVPSTSPTPMPGVVE